MIFFLGGWGRKAIYIFNRHIYAYKYIFRSSISNIENGATDSLEFLIKSCRYYLEKLKEIFSESFKVINRTIQDIINDLIIIP